MEKFTIAISRDYGSGGRLIGELLSKELGIAFYDKSIIHMVAEKSGLSAGFIEKSDENIPNTFLLNLKYTAYSSIESMAYYDAPVSDKVFLAQSSVIKELAASESCVIVGRCADYILRDQPTVVRIFIHAELKDRIKRAVEKYDLPSEGAEDAIRKIDKSRANYYKYYTSKQWGLMQNYDLIINTSFCGIEGATAVIKTLLHEKSLI